MNPLQTLTTFGQSVWYDNLSRAMIKTGELQRLITEDGLRGLTSNPTIFEKAITGSTDYDGALRQLLQSPTARSSRELFYELAIADIQAAADLFLPVFEQTQGVDGYVSLEVSPDLAHDSAATVAEARRLAARVGRPNLMIKVPATIEGLPVIEALISEGLNVNVTLLFAVERYGDVVDAYFKGLESAQRAGRDLSKIASVASFFVSRVDNHIDKLLNERLAKATPEQASALKKLQGRLAIANAKLAYQLYQERCATPRWQALAAAGARPQRLLWASTGTKNPAYSDILYVEALIGPETVNTMPPATYQAYKDHGKPTATLQLGMAEAGQDFARLAALGIDISAVTQQLEDEGVASFHQSFKTLLAALEAKTRQLTQAA